MGAECDGPGEFATTGEAGAEGGGSARERVSTGRDDTGAD